MKSILLFTFSFYLLLALATTAAVDDLVVNDGSLFPIATFQTYSGYLQVSATKSYHYMFYTSSSKTPTTDPVVLWLNGGPGCSSLMGAFQENGPFLFNINATGLQATINPYSWNTFANVLYIESPAGVGFSNGTYDEIINNSNDNTTAKDNLQAILQWFSRFTNYITNDFYVTGESYAGTYVPFTISAIDTYNKNSLATPINLKGWVIGNGCTHPTECVNRKMFFKDQDMSTYIYDFYWGQGKYSPESRQLYESTCMVNPNTDPCEEIRKTIRQEVGILWNQIDVYDIYRTCYNQTIPNIDPNDVPPCTDALAAYNFFRNGTVTNLLHVNNINNWTMCSSNVSSSYQFYTGASYWVYEQLVPLNKYKILIYSGDTDSSVPITGTLHWINQLRNELQLPVLNPWRPWYYPGAQAGESQVGGMVMELEGLTFASVRGVGHMVPQWGPSQAKVMLTNFIAGTELPSQ